MLHNYVHLDYWKSTLLGAFQNSSEAISLPQKDAEEDTKPTSV